MAEHREKHTIFGPFPDADPLDSARLFLRTNRYQIVSDELGPRPEAFVHAPKSLEEEAEEEEEEKEEEEDEPGEVVVRLEAERGEKWAAFTTSNMADLATTLTVALVGNSVQLDYVVTTTGQFLNDDERGYWKREAQALEAFLTGDGDIENIASDEATRASTARRELLGAGAFIAGIVFIIVFVAGLILLRT